MERCNVCATTMLDEQYFVERRPLSNGLLVHEANRSLLRLRHEKKSALAKSVAMRSQNASSLAFCSAAFSVITRLAGRRTAREPAKLRLRLCM